MEKLTINVNFNCFGSNTPERECSSFYDIWCISLVNLLTFAQRGAGGTSLLNNAQYCVVVFENLVGVPYTVRSFIIYVNDVTLTLT